MAQRTRTRGLVLWLMLALALALPLAGSAAEEDEDADTAGSQASQADDEESAAADEGEDEGEEEQEAEEADWSVTHRGFYLLASGSYDFMTNKSDLEEKGQHAAELGAVNSHVEDSWGYGGRIGWRVFDRLALEGEFQMLNSIEIHNHEQATGDNKRSKATFMNAMANAKGYLLTDRIQPYAMAGAGYGYAVLDPPGGRAKDRDQGFAAQFGVGSDFYLTENIGLMTEVAYLLPTGDIEDYDYVGIDFGIMLRFYAE